MQGKTVLFRWIRMGCYAILFLTFFFLPYEAVADGWFRCPSTWVGLQCPGCGVTRAFSLLLHGDLAAAWQMNPVFCAVIYPAFWATAGQDIAVTLLKRRCSFLEYLLGLLR